MHYLLLTIIQIVDSIAELILVSLGLAVIFGMMRVINLAHGEFIMLGGFTSIFAVNAGINVWVAILVVAPCVVGVLGMIIERIIIRHLYGRMVYTMLATWGLSLLLTGLATTLFGNRVQGISAPLGSVDFAGFSISLYNQLMVVVCLILLVGGYALLRYTRLGLIARATMQNPEMAASMGINRSRVFAMTFSLGAALSGLTGALLAPLSGVVPTMGAAYVSKAFITVITGGASVITGTGLSAALLGSIGTVTTFLSNPIFGDIALLAAALVLLRILPTGITGKIFRGAS
ncbi:MAG: branched-chain amino acid ABC transporter permease [Pantoea sp.]|uniref:ABC transporter permease subunit n=1 Tax=Pantoea sp. TaxID=69393 RepID=UPI0023901B80|nr:branched-chain amino acid ABC transporter permease [Pantoea sp.]MDE1185426.1 branched-chain amino acid ABC transporter permease [Pantoea sp.]